MVELLSGIYAMTEATEGKFRAHSHERMLR
jgi:hypothetical protein